MTATPVFQIPVRIYWEDTDAGGIVYHANYLNFMERARTEWLRALELEQLRLREQYGGIFVVSDIALRYLLPARLDDLLHVTVELQNAARASVTLRQTVYRTEPARTATLCDGTVRIGWVNSGTLRLERIPESVLKRIS